MDMISIHPWATKGWKKRRMNIYSTELWNIKKALRQKVTIRSGDTQMRLQLLQLRQKFFILWATLA